MARPAMLSQGSDRDFAAPRVPKQDRVRDLLHCSIRRNVLFRACTRRRSCGTSSLSAEAWFSAGAVVIIRKGNGVTSTVS